MTYGGVTRPTNFDLSNFERDKWKLATFVLGEGASATIVAPGGGSLRYEQRNDSAGYRASYVRLPQTERFIARSRPLFDAPEMTFYSDPSRLLTHGVSLGFEVFDSLQRGNLEDVVVIPHTISTRLLRFLKARYGDDLPVVDLFPDFGNLGTVSLSAGLAWLERERMCHKGAWPGRPVGWMLSAGMSAVAFEFPN
jgi:hypothetical protein